MKTMKKSIASLLLLGSFGLLSACDYLASYTKDIQQGNIIEEKEVVQLKPGMTQTQVGNLMGYPVYDNTFDNQRWVYVYTSKKGRQPIVHKRLILTFKNKRLSKIQRG